MYFAARNASDNVDRPDANRMTRSKSVRHFSRLKKCLTLLGLLAAGGCDKLPWPLSGKEQPHAAPTATAAAPAGVTPNKPAVTTGDVLATVNGIPISKADLELRIQEFKVLVMSQKKPWNPLTSEELGSKLDEVISSELLSQDATARGLDRTTEVQRRWEYARRAFFAQEWLRSAQDRASVGPDDVAKYYQDNLLAFRVPEKRQLRHLVVSTEEEVNRALARLHGEGVDFAALVQQISVAPTAAQGGMLSHWVMRANVKAILYPSESEAVEADVMSLDPALEASAFAIDKENGLSNYVKGADNKYHIFQLVTLEKERQRRLEEVSDLIKNGLTLQRLQESVRELQEKAKIERFPERLLEVSQP